MQELFGTEYVFSLERVANPPPSLITRVLLETLPGQQLSPSTTFSAFPIESEMLSPQAESTQTLRAAEGEWGVLGIVQRGSK